MTPMLPQRLKFDTPGADTPCVTSRIPVVVPSLVRLDLGASLDVAWAQQDGELVAMPPGAKLALLAGRFEWQVDDEASLPITLVFVRGAKRMMVSLSAG